MGRPGGSRKLGSAPSGSRCCLAGALTPLVALQTESLLLQAERRARLLAGRAPEHPHQHVPSPIKAWSPHQHPGHLLRPPAPTTIPPSPCLGLLPRQAALLPRTRLGVCTHGHCKHRPPSRGLPCSLFVLPFSAEGVWPLQPGAAIPGGQSWTLLLVPCLGRATPVLAQPVLSWGSGGTQLFRCFAQALPAPQWWALNP